MEAWVRLETAEQIKRIVDVNLQEPCSRCHILYDMCGDLLRPEYKATGKITREGEGEGHCIYVRHEAVTSKAHTPWFFVTPVFSAEDL